LNDKNSMKMLCLEIFPQKKFWWNCLQKQTNHGKHSYFPFCFRPVFGRFSAAFVQNRRQYSRKIFQVSHFFCLFGQFCVILTNFRPAGNRAYSIVMGSPEYFESFFQPRLWRVFYYKRSL
jgi:hypothetical protein